MIVWVNARFQAWGQWVQMDRGMGSKGMSASWGTVGGSNFKQAIIPVKDLECSRTHDWVRSLEKEKQLLLFEMYCTPRTSREHAAQLKMSLRTLYGRLHELMVQYAARGRDRAGQVTTSTEGLAAWMGELQALYGGATKSFGE